MKKAWLLFLILLGVMALPVVGHTALVERYLSAKAYNAGVADAYYDTELNITWLADATLAKTQSFGVGGIHGLYGTMGWSTALAWINAMNGQSYLGYSSWRLPTLSPVQGGDALNWHFSNNATTDNGTAKTTTDGNDGGWRDQDGNATNEMGHMYYVNLGNLGKFIPNDNDPSKKDIQNGWTDPSYGSFTISETGYWTGQMYGDNAAWKFNIYSGESYTLVSSQTQAVWAVHGGDLPSVPLPGAVWLLGSGLIGLVGFRKKFKKS